MEELESAFTRWDQERREEARVPLELEVRWEGHGASHVARTREIGSRGCFIASREKVGVGNRLIFEVKTPTERWMRLFGEVIYELGEEGFGVRFKFLSAEDRATLARLMEYAGGEQRSPG